MNWLCDKCGTENRDIIQVCLHCFQSRSAVAKEVMPVEGNADADQERTWPCVPSAQFGFRRITEHFSRGAKFGQMAYFFWMFSQLILFLGLAIRIVSLLRLPPRTNLNSLSDVALAFGGIVLAPLLETLLFQSLFCAIGRWCNLGFWAQVVLVWIPFFLGHFGESAGTAWCVGLVGGFFFSLTYVTKRAESLGRAYWTTAALHALNNSCALGFILASRHHWF